MKEPYGRRSSQPDDPESCAGDRKASRSVDRGTHRRVIEPRNQNSGVPTLLSDGEGNTRTTAGEIVLASRGTETLCMCGSSLNGNREIPRSARHLDGVGPCRED